MFQQWPNRRSTPFQLKWEMLIIAHLTLLIQIVCPHPVALINSLLQNYLESHLTPLKCFVISKQTSWDLIMFKLNRMCSKYRSRWQLRWNIHRINIHHSKCMFRAWIVYELISDWHRILKYFTLRGTETVKTKIYINKLFFILTSQIYWTLFFEILSVEDLTIYFRTYVKICNSISELV